MSVVVELVEGPVVGRGGGEVFAGCGAVVRFEGVVRPLEGGEAIVGLRYEAYAGMAVKELRKLGEEVIARFGVEHVRVWHSVGFVGNGECSFVLVVAAKHRKEGLGGMDYFIDAMKREVPLWKVAVGEGGGTGGKC